MQQIFNPIDIFWGVKKEKTPTNQNSVYQRDDRHRISTPYHPNPDTGGGDVLTQAGELGGKAEEKQTQPRTEEEIPQGLSGIGEEVRRYL